MFYNIQGKIVYYVAAVCIVYDRIKHQQQFFLGHDDDIVCLALHPDRRTVATGQLGKDPYVLIWDSVGMVQLQRLQHGYLLLQHEVAVHAAAAKGDTGVHHG